MLVTGPCQQQSKASEDVKVRDVMHHVDGHCGRLDLEFMLLKETIRSCTLGRADHSESYLKLALPCVYAVSSCNSLHDRSHGPITRRFELHCFEMFVETLFRRALLTNFLSHKDKWQCMTPRRPQGCALNVSPRDINEKNMHWRQSGI